MKACPVLEALALRGILCVFVLAALFQGLAQPSVTLAWDPSADPSIVGYSVYRGTESQSYTSVTMVGNVTQASFAGLVAGTTYYFAVTAYDTNQISSDFSTEVSFTPVAFPSSPELGYNFAADAGSISSPFVSTNGDIFQSVSTGAGDGGRAVYIFKVDDPDYYTIAALVNAANPEGNSFCVNVDGEPIEPEMIWNIPVTSGFESNVVTWQDSPDPKVFPLSIGDHQLIVRGRSADTQLGAISLNLYQALSTPWQTAVIGTDVLPTEAVYSNGVYTIRGAGALTGGSDNFRFVYRSFTGDGAIRARVPSVESQNPASYAGVMVREDLTPGSAYISFGITRRHTFLWHKRDMPGHATASAVLRNGSGDAGWVKVIRKGNVFSVSMSVDGKHWRVLARRLIPMAATVYFGFIVASGAIDEVATATFDNATLGP